MASALSLQSLGLILLATFLFQTIAVAISFIYFNNMFSTMKESFSQSSVSCLMKANNVLSASDLYDQGEEGRKSDPCWQITQQLHYRIEKTMTERFQKEISTAVRNKLTSRLPIMTQGSRETSLPKVAAHVTGLASPGEQRGKGSWSSRGCLGEPIGAWEGQRGLSFLLNMELRGGELVASHPGLYYIYAQTYFRLPPSEETEGEAKGETETETETEGEGEESTHLFQYIYKKMASYPVPILLMKSSRSACWFHSPEPGLFSLHQAGTARLQPADRLFVSVSNASLMERDGRASYFGAFLLG
ncbi:tumor necrosis factor ligand superfamily member 10-like [Aplochiton taeniatus]